MNSGEDQQARNDLAEIGEFDISAQIGLWEVSSRSNKDKSSANIQIASKQTETGARTAMKDLTQILWSP